MPLFAGRLIGIAVVPYRDRLIFGLGADRASMPDLDVLAEGVETSYAELRRIATQAGPRPGRSAAPATT